MMRITKELSVVDYPQLPRTLRKDEVVIRFHGRIAHEAHEVPVLIDDWGPVVLVPSRAVEDQFSSWRPMVVRRSA